MAQPSDQGETGDHERQARAAAADDAARERRADHHHHRHRHGVEPGLHGREAADVLQVERVEEEEAAERGEGGHRDRGRRRERDRAEEAQVDQRLLAARLVAGAGRPAPAPAAESTARICADAQPRLGASMIAVGQRGQQHDHQRPGRPGRTDAAAAPSTRGRTRSVSTIAASPTGMLIQKIDRQPIEETSAPPTIGPERHGDAEHGAPDADRLRPLARVGEGVGDDRHRDRVEHRGAHRLEHAEGDQAAHARRQAAQERRRPRTRRGR